MELCPSETSGKESFSTEWPEYDNLDHEDYLSQHFKQDDNQTLRPSSRQRKPNTRYGDYILE